MYGGAIWGQWGEFCDFVKTNTRVDGVAAWFSFSHFTATSLADTTTTQTK
ncbi:MAG: hypothetical protein ACRC46_07790 [Thermoguttaceae bacterium]